MTAYTEEADKAITAAQRTVEPGDLVTHEDLQGCVHGRVFSVEEGTVHVLWGTSGTPHPTQAERVHFLERPNSYACVTVTGKDEVGGSDMDYTFVSVGTADEIREDLQTYRKVPTYTVNSFRVEGETDTDD